MKDTLVIMGSHPRTRGLFDFNRDVDIWIFNEAMSQSWAKRADGVFQLHIPTIWRNPNNRNDPKHYEWLKSGNTPPVFMQEKYDDVPNSVQFPKDEILSMLPNARQNGELIREVSCSPAWALAYAIYLGYKRIEIYGVELASNTEYHYQQANFKYWLGVAVGRGIEVNLHSDMFNAPLYGYEGEVFVPYDEFGARVTELEEKRDETEFISEMKKLEIEVDKLRHMDNTKAVLEGVNSTIIAAVRLGAVDGAIQENKKYIQKADAMKAQSDDFVFSRQEFEYYSAGLQKETEKIKNELQALKGQLDIYHDSVLKAAKESPKRDKLLAGYKGMLSRFIAGNNKLGIYMGAMNENNRYMARLDDGIRAAGGAKSEEAILHVAQ